MSISIYLLNINLKELAKLSGKALVALVCAVFSVCLVATAFGVVFGSRMFEGWKIAGMFVGTYTGGSANLTAIAVGLNAANETIAAANAADYVIGMPTLFLMFAAPALFQNVKFLKQFWPYHLSDEERIGDNEEPVLMAEQKWSIQDIACLLAVSVTVATISTKLASFLPPDFASAGRILLISTISIAAAQKMCIRDSSWTRGGFHSHIQDRGNPAACLCDRGHLQLLLPVPLNRRHPERHGGLEERCGEQDQTPAHRLF